MYPIFGFQDTITKWVFEKTGGSWTPGIASGIGIGDGDKILAAAAFTDFTGPSVAVHLAIDERRATLPLFELIGAYAFEQLGCRRLTLVAESSNLKAVRLHEKLGAIHEGTLVGAGRKGDDILISRLTPEANIWRKLNERRSRTRIKGGSAASPGR